MAYTLLRATPAGVVLRDYHARRFSESAALAGAWQRATEHLAPGIWAARSEGGEIVLEARAGSLLREWMPAQLLRSPVADARGAFPKPRPPCVYDPLRLPGIAALLTSDDGMEIYEAAAAAVVAWDGARLVCVPDDRPRVWSTAETAIREHLSPRIAPILSREGWPILLVNAVRGCCRVAAPGRSAFPQAVRRQIEGLFDSLTHRGGADPCPC